MPSSRGSRAMVSDSSRATAVATARVSAHETRCAANTCHVRVDHDASEMWYQSKGGDGAEVLPWMKRYYEARDGGDLSQYRMPDGWRIVSVHVSDYTG